MKEGLGERTENSRLLAKPNLKNILTFSNDQNGGKISEGDKKNAIQDFGFCLPQLYRDEENFTGTFISELSKVYSDLDDNQKLVFNENSKVLIKALYENNCIDKSEFDNICLEYSNKYISEESNVKLFLNEMKTVVQVKASDVSFPVLDNLEISDNYDANVKQTAETFRASISYMLGNVTPGDLYGQRWSKQEKDTPLNVVIEAFNRTSNYIVQDILSEKTLDTAQAKAVFWGDVLNSAIESGDYNTACAINSAFNNTSLKTARINELGHFEGKERLQKALDEASNLFSSNRNFKNLKEKMANDRAQGKVYIPYVGLKLTEYTFSDDGAGNKVNNDFNYEAKGKLLSNILGLLIAEKEKIKLASNELRYYNSEVIKALQDKNNDNPNQEELDRLRGKFIASNRERAFGQITEFLDNFIKKNKDDSKVFTLPEYLTVRYDNNQNFSLDDEVDSHRFIMGEIAFRLANARAGSAEISNDEMSGLLNALHNNALARKLSSDILNGYDSLAKCVQNRHLNKHDQKLEDRVMLLALSHAISHNLNEQKGLQEKVVNHADREGTIKQGVKQRVNLINNRLKEIEKERKKILNKIKDPSEYDTTAEKLYENDLKLRGEVSNYFLELTEIKDTYFNMPIFNKASEFKKMVETGIESAIKNSQDKLTGRMPVPSNPAPPPPVQSEVKKPEAVESDSEMEFNEPGNVDSDDEYDDIPMGAYREPSPLSEFVEKQPDSLSSISQDESESFTLDLDSDDDPLGERNADFVKSTATIGVPEAADPESADLVNPERHSAPETPKEKSGPEQAFSFLSKQLKRAGKAIFEENPNEREFKLNVRDISDRLNAVTARIDATQGYTIVDVKSLIELQDKLAKIREAEPAKYQQMAATVALDIAINLNNIQKNDADIVYAAKVGHLELKYNLIVNDKESVDIEKYNKLTLLLEELVSNDLKFKGNPHFAKLANQVMVAHSQMTSDLMMPLKCDRINKVVASLSNEDSLKTDGILRVSGATAEVKNAYDALIKNASSDLPVGVHNRTGILKLLLESPPPLMTKEEGAALSNQLKEKDADAGALIVAALDDIKGKDPKRAEALASVLVLLEQVATQNKSNQMKGSNIMIALNATDALFNMPQYTGSDYNEAAEFQDQITKLNTTIGEAINNGIFIKSLDKTADSILDDAQSKLESEDEEVSFTIEIDDDEGPEFVDDNEPKQRERSKSEPGASRPTEPPESEIKKRRP